MFTSQSCSTRKSNISNISAHAADKDYLTELAVFTPQMIITCIRIAQQLQALRFESKALSDVPHPFLQKTRDYKKQVKCNPTSETVKFRRETFVDI